MNRWAALGSLVGLTLVVPLACQGPDAFYRPISSGAGGHASGLGGSGLGGFLGSGGARGNGGALGTGGRGAGGAFGAGGAAGRNTGGATGAGGAAGTTGVAGTTGTAGTTGIAGNSGSGGRTVDAGTGCVATLIASGYTAGTATPCSMCKDNQVSLETKCTGMIDCIAPKYPCTGCFTDCLNMVGGSAPVDTCVRALITAACTTN